MTPADLSRTVVRAVRRAVEDGELPAGAVVPERVVVERTRPGGVGEYASPVAFQLARTAGRAPRDVARVLAGRLGEVPGIARVEITGAGFLNFVLAGCSAAELVREVRARGPRYGFAAGEGAEAGEGGEAGEAGEGRETDEGPAPAPAHPAPAPPATAPGLRERVVREAVQRLLRSQGRATRTPAPETGTAPVARRDGDVVARYGWDAVVWAVLSVPGRETPEFRPALLVQDESSDLFRVRYALTRARALTRNAARLGFHGEPGDPAGGVAEPLLRALADHPLVLEAAAHHRAPERLARHLVALADALLDFQYHVLPQGDGKPSAAHRARLALAEAAGTVLAGGLTLLGMDAPERL
ncbi:ArgS-related anticodon-binding protein NrtL [Streptomyces sp. NPDC051567]|uniref:ArgS-related anticodon-binding protein NrtL n=1 Tax=Streptomyces sp. NPDC051567 TaxID=3365660 RepID=UPI0037BD7B36